MFQDADVLWPDIPRSEVLLPSRTTSGKHDSPISHFLRETRHGKLNSVVGCSRCVLFHVWELAGHNLCSDIVLGSTASKVSLAGKDTRNLTPETLWVSLESG